MHPDSPRHSKSKSSERSNETRAHTRTRNRRQINKNCCHTFALLIHVADATRAHGLHFKATHATAAAVLPALSKVLEVCDFSLQMACNTEGNPPMMGILKKKRWRVPFVASAVSGGWWWHQKKKCSRNHLRFVQGICVRHSQKTAKLILLWFYVRFLHREKNGFHEIVPIKMVERLSVHQLKPKYISFIILVHLQCSGLHRHSHSSRTKQPSNRLHKPWTVSGKWL